MTKYEKLLCTAESPAHNGQGGRPREYVALWLTDEPADGMPASVAYAVFRRSGEPRKHGRIGYDPAKTPFATTMDAVGLVARKAMFSTQELEPVQGADPYGGMFLGQPACYWVRLDMQAEGPDAAYLAVWLDKSGDGARYAAWSTLKDDMHAPPMARGHVRPADGKASYVTAQDALNDVLPVAFEGRAAKWQNRPSLMREEGIDVAAAMEEAGAGIPDPNAFPGPDMHACSIPCTSVSDGNAPSILAARLNGKSAEWYRYDGGQPYPSSWGEIIYDDTPGTLISAVGTRPKRAVLNRQITAWPDEPRAARQDGNAPVTVAGLLASAAKEAFTGAAACEPMPLPDGTDPWALGQAPLVCEVVDAENASRFLVLQWSDNPAESENCDSCIAYWLFDGDMESEIDGGEMDYDSGEAGYMALPDAVSDVAGFAWPEPLPRIRSIYLRPDLTEEDFGI